MDKMIKAPCGVVLTINRPDGTVDRVENRRFWLGEIPAGTYKQMVAATKAAGRGDIVSYEPIYEMIKAAEPTAAERSREAYETQRRSIERVSATGRA